MTEKSFDKSVTYAYSSSSPLEVLWRQANNLPSIEAVLHAPDEPEACYSHQRQTKGFGYQAHRTAICDEDCLSLISGIETTLATTQDDGCVEKSSGFG